MLVNGGLERIEPPTDRLEYRSVSLLDLDQQGAVAPSNLFDIVADLLEADFDIVQALCHDDLVFPEAGNVVSQSVLADAQLVLAGPELRDVASERGLSGSELGLADLELGDVLPESGLSRTETVLAFP
jgi:hypothetical protein